MTYRSAVRYVVGRVFRRGIWRKITLAQVHHMQRVELVDAKIICQLIGNIVAHIVQDARGLTLNGSNDSGSRGLDRANDAANAAAQDSTAGGCGGGRRCGRGSGGTVAFCHTLDKVLAEGGCVEDDDMVVLHESLFAAGEESKHGEHKAHHGEYQGYGGSELHCVRFVGAKSRQVRPVSRFWLWCPMFNLVVRRNRWLTLEICVSSRDKTLLVSFPQW